MALFGALQAWLGVETKEWESKWKLAEKPVDGLANKTKGFFSQLKQGIPADGGLLGGLKIGMISAATAAMGRFGDSLKTASMEFRAGEKSAGEFFQQMARGIPILGNAYKFGEGIGEFFTGSLAEANREFAQFVNHAKALNAVTAQMNAFGNRSGDFLKDMDDQQKGFRRMLQLENADEATRIKLKIDFDTEDAKEKAKSGLLAMHAEIDKLTAARIAMEKKRGKAGFDQEVYDAQEKANAAFQAKMFTMQQEYQDTITKIDAVATAKRLAADKEAIDAAAQAVADRLSSSKKTASDIADVAAKFASEESQMQASLKDVQGSDLLRGRKAFNDASQDNPTARGQETQTALLATIAAGIQVMVAPKANPTATEITVVGGM